MYTNKLFAGENLPKAFKEEENLKYLEKLLDGDYSARNTLIEHNLKLVVYFVRKFENKTNDLEDLVSIGTIGLIKGIDTFKLEYQSKFSSYVGRCIVNEILMFFRKQKSKKISEVSLDDSLSKDEFGNDLTILATIFDDSQTSEEYLEEKETYKELFESFSVLSDLEAKVIQMRYGFGYIRMTQEEVGNEFNFSRSYISRIETKAKLKITNFLEARLAEKNDLNEQESSLKLINLKDNYK